MLSSILIATGGVGPSSSSVLLAMQGFWSIPVDVDIPPDHDTHDGQDSNIEEIILDDGSRDQEATEQENRRIRKKLDDARELREQVEQGFGIKPAAESIVAKTVSAKPELEARALQTQDDIEQDDEDVIAIMNFIASYYRG